MAKNIMIAGTMSSAGKSFIVTALCRYYTNKGYRVAPFKSQNMALNSFVTGDGLEMGRAQVAQAEACKKAPTVQMNPILLKPTTDVGSQVIVHGRPVGNMRAAEYFKYKTSLIPEIISAYNQLAEDNDIIFIEGAGSIAEINLKKNDIVNMGLAALLDAPVLLVGDIDPGGVFAQLYGTLELLEEDEKNRIAGLIINKFRGDVSLLAPGITMLEEKCKRKVVGVVPMGQVYLDEEDSITSAFSKDIEKDAIIDIAVIRLPHISNFTDFEAFKLIEKASVRYVDDVRLLGSPDMIILPGTKSTIADLAWLKESGLAACIEGLSVKVPVCGICGGYQMLGLSIADPEGIEGGGNAVGLGLIPMETVLSAEKTTRQISGTLDGLTGVFSCLNGLSFEGYEIHNGVSQYVNITGQGQESLGDKSHADSSLSSLSDNEHKAVSIMGTYVHGVFDKAGLADKLVEALAREKGLDFSSNTDLAAYKDQSYDRMAELIGQALDMDMVDKIIGL